MFDFVTFAKSQEIFIGSIQLLGKSISSEIPKILTQKKPWLLQEVLSFVFVEKFQAGLQNVNNILMELS